MEVSEFVNRTVWMTSSSVEQSDFDALEVDEFYTKVGIGCATMDRAGFRYSPGLLLFLSPSFLPPSLSPSPSPFPVLSRPVRNALVERAPFGIS